MNEIDPMAGRAPKPSSRDGRRGSRPVLKACAVLAAAAATVFGVCKGAEKLCSVWAAQCVVRDVRSQVEVRATPHVNEDLILGLLRVTNGCNLATMDFSAAREAILRSQPMIRNLEISRRLPDGLVVSVEERVPVARVNYSSMKIRLPRGGIADHGRWDAVDADGVVFNFSLDDTKLLPRILETRPSAKRGERLSDRALVALRLIDLCRRREFANIRLRDVDISNGTYLRAATGDYDVVEIDWTYPDDPSSPDQPKLSKAVREILDIGKSRLSGALRNVFVVTETGRVNMMPYDRENAR